MRKVSFLSYNMTQADGANPDGLIPVGRQFDFIGDVETEEMILCDGDEGLFCAYDKIEFLAPVYAGDYIEAYGEIEKVGNTSRVMNFEARKVIVSRPDISPSAADVLAEPIVVCRAHGTCVTPKDCQRKK